MRGTQGTYSVGVFTDSAAMTIQHRDLCLADAKAIVREFNRTHELDCAVVIYHSRTKRPKLVPVVFATRHFCESYCRSFNRGKDNQFHAVTVQCTDN
ncbi:MAG TPA: hypothetical protein VNH18_32480 [Bryobacteraceae bacterium]|nr:hypothetical protein [Bryobacteraceae bacterium]